jgi:hypothetical protein
MTPELFSQRIAELKAIVAAYPKDDAPLQMPVINFGRRESLTELRPRHLLFVEEAALNESFNQSKLHDWFFKNWTKLFGSSTIRYRKADEQPSDQMRKHFMVAHLLELISMRRGQIGERERREANIKFDSIPRSQRAAFLPPG